MRELAGELERKKLRKKEERREAEERGREKEMFFLIREERERQ